MRAQGTSEKVAVEESSHWATEWKEEKGVESDVLGEGWCNNFFGNTLLISFM